MKAEKKTSCENYEREIFFKTTHCELDTLYFYFHSTHVPLARSAGYIFTIESLYIYILQQVAPIYLPDVCTWQGLFILIHNGRFR